MNLTVLGTSAGFAGKNDACSSYLLSVGGKNHLIDMGPGSLASLQNHIGFRELDAVLVSHLHADHVSDLYTFRFAVSVAQKEGSMPHPFPIYLPDQPSGTYSFIRSNIEEEFSMIVVGEGKDLDLDGLTVRFLRTRHPVLAHAMRFEHEGRVFVYTTDTSYFEDLVVFCSGADLLLAEATLQDRDRELEEMGHMTARTAGRLARQAGVHTLVLTHIWPEYDRKPSLDEAKESFPGSLHVAERGLKLSI
jgi:ribonuclease BN (tRNA processing enzyme)